MYIYAYIYIVFISGTWTKKGIYIYIYICTYTFIYMYIYIYVHIYTYYVYIYINKYIGSVNIPRKISLQISGINIQRKDGSIEGGKKAYLKVMKDKVEQSLITGIAEGIYMIMHYISRIFISFYLFLF
jgi:hypothetical protein